MTAYYYLEKYNIFGINNTGLVVLSDSVVKYIADHKDKDDTERQPLHK